MTPDRDARVEALYQRLVPLLPGDVEPPVDVSVDPDGTISVTLPGRVEEVEVTAEVG